MEVRINANNNYCRDDRHIILSDGNSIFREATKRNEMDSKNAILNLIKAGIQEEYNDTNEVKIIAKIRGEYDKFQINKEDNNSIYIKNKSNSCDDVSTYEDINSKSEGTYRIQKGHR